MTSARRKASYVPERGQAVWMHFDPQAGHEQSGRRPAVILSPRSYNARSGLALVCPITSRAKEYPFEVAMPGGCKLSGNALTDQLRSVDWRARKAERICDLPPETMAEILGKARTLLD